MYKALYRKWRPMTFDDVISQQQTTDTLKNQIMSGKTAHAYLFTGSRGTGKTTCARILAKAVNCRNMKDGNPCLECDICRDADSGALTDIVEIDAASNNGVDNIRDLRDAAVYTPDRGQYKIYIIDEVHMLSAGAFNALLKIMEEPPPYVKFILATTEIHKVPATILSRCQRFDFRRIKPEDIAARLKYIAEQEELTLTDGGAAMIAKLADGGMRDAVSLLDRCSVGGEEIDEDVVSAAAGIAGRDYLFGLLEAVNTGDTAKALSITASLYDMSKDIGRLCEELISQLRNIMLIKVSPDTAESLIVCVAEEMQKLRELADSTELETVMSHISILQECSTNMNRAMNRRVEFEMALIKLCGNIRNTTEAIDNSEIYDKIKQLEDKIKNVPVQVQAAPQQAQQPEVLTASAPQTETDVVPTGDYANRVKCNKWDAIMEEFKIVNPAVAGSLDGSYAEISGNKIFITSQNRFFIELFKVRENANSLNYTIDRVLGQHYFMQARCPTTVEEQKNLAQELIKTAQKNNIPVEVDNSSN